MEMGKLYNNSYEGRVFLKTFQYEGLDKSIKGDIVHLYIDMVSMSILVTLFASVIPVSEKSNQWWCYAAKANPWNKIPGYKFYWK